MTGKLIKYEFRSTMKIMGIVWAALLAMALMTGLFNEVGLAADALENFGSLGGLVSAVTSFLYGSIFTATGAVTVVIVLLRFYKGLLGNEGYLMHTLPVKTWQLITAKGVVAAVVSLLSILAAILSILILMAFEGGLVGFGDFLSDSFRFVKEYPVVIAIFLECLLLGVAWIAAVIYKTYAALSIGQLAQKHKILLSVGAWIGISAAFMVLLTAAGNLFFPSSLASWISDIVSDMMENKVDSLVQLGLWVCILAEAVQIAVYHAISEEILRRKLNLE